MGVAVVAVEVAQFDGAGGLPQGYDDFEVSALSCIGRGLDDAAGSGYIVLFTRDSLPADPGQTGGTVVGRPGQVDVAVVAVPIPQLFAFYDDCLKIPWLPRPKSDWMRLTYTLGTSTVPSNPVV